MTKEQYDPFLTPISDFVRLCRKQKKKIYYGMGLMALFAAVYTLTNPVEYLAEGTFRERSTKPSNLTSSNIGSMFISNFASNDNEAIAALKSKTLMKKVVEKLGLQASIDQTGFSDTYFGRIKEHLITDYANFFNHLTHSLNDFEHPFRINDIFYNGEVPVFLSITHQPDNTFIITNNTGSVIGEGSYGIPFKTAEFKFTLDRTGHFEPNSTPYNLAIWPLSFKAEQLRRKMKVDTDTKDKSIIKLAYGERDRHLSCQIVNATMLCYQDFLKTHHDRQSELQLAYLKQRQDETALDLAEIMHKHAQSLSEDLSSVGFADSEKEMAFLANNQHQLKDQLLAKELEMKRLQNVLCGSCVYYDRYGTDGDPAVINNILEQIRSQKTQRDSLQLALSKSNYLDTDNIHNSLNEELQELKEAQIYSEEIENAIVAYSQNQFPSLELKIFNDPRYLLKTWHDNLFSEIPNPNSPQYREWEDRKERFLFYLENLKRIFAVNVNIIQERLSHQYNPSQEFQGINLRTAEELYIGYSRQMSEIESNINKNQFLTSQIDDPDFEISSLSSTLSDSVSQSMIARTSQLALDLKDLNNRTSKEQERLKHELDLQRNFLALHLKQMTKLMELNLKLLEEKVFNLQSIMLDLTYQQISLLQKNLNDYITSRLANLKDEGKIIQLHIDEIHANMATLPQRWVSEKLIEQNVTTNRLIVEEIAKMVEFKNINHKLELIQSSPIDIAMPSIHAQSSGFVLKSIVGAVLGFIGVVTYLFGNALRTGMIASNANLHLKGQQVAGAISKDYKQGFTSLIRDNDLSTLRRLQAYLCRSLLKKGNRALLIEGRGPDYSSDLASLLVKKGLSVITLSLNFNEISKSKDPGLLQFLSNQTTEIKIHNTENGDRVEAGGFTRFSTELLGNQKFHDLLAQLEKKYDWILLASDALPTSSEADNLLQLANLVVVSIEQETLPQLEKYFIFGSEKGHQVSFVMLDNDQQ